MDDVVACIQPHRSPGGVVVLAALAARPTQLLVPTRWFHEMVVDALRLRKLRKPQALAKVPTMILWETRGLQLFWVVRGGIGLIRRLGAELQHTERLTTYSILSLEPERHKNRWATPGHET